MEVRKVRGIHSSVLYDKHQTECKKEMQKNRNTGCIYICIDVYFVEYKS